MRLQQYLTEKFYNAINNSELRTGGSTDGYRGYREIFVNPTDKELQEIGYDKDNGYAVILIDKKTALFFSDKMLHQDVIEKFNINKKTMVTLRAIETGRRAFSIEGSDTMQGGSWDNEEELEQFIRNHTYMKKYRMNTIDLRYAIY